MGARMKRLVSFPLEDGGSVVVEAEGDADGTVTRGLMAGGVVQAAGSSFEAAVEAIVPAAAVVVRKLRAGLESPDGVEVEFGLKFSGQAGAFIASAGTEAQFRVKLSWLNRRES